MKLRSKIRWRLVVGISFGFLVWYVGAGMFQQWVASSVKLCCPAFGSHFLGDD